MMRYEPSNWQDRRIQKRKMRLYWQGYLQTHKGEQDYTWDVIFAVFAGFTAVCLLAYVLVFVH